MTADATHTEARDWLARELKRHGLTREAATAIMGAADTYAARAVAAERAKLLAERGQAFLDAVTAERDLSAALADGIRSLLTSGPIGQQSGERYIRADLIREVLSKHDATRQRQDQP